MRMISRFNRWSGLAQSGALLAAVTYILQPVSASAAAVKVCAAAGDACSSFINKYVQPVILLLTASIGVFAVISYIVAAIQYSSAGDDPSAVSKAKNRAFKTTIGLLAYFFLFAFLNFLVPGGLF
ncbi:MAG TPA: hypothetical protein VF466_04240 [Candidatus Saccharimonadales bacterium]